MKPTQRDPGRPADTWWKRINTLKARPQSYRYRHRTFNTIGARQRKMEDYGAARNVQPGQITP